MALGIALWKRLRQKHMFPSVSPVEGRLKPPPEGWEGQVGLVTSQAVMARFASADVSPTTNTACPSARGVCVTVPTPAKKKPYFCMQGFS